MLNVCLWSNYSAFFPLYCRILTRTAYLQAVCATNYTNASQAGEDWWTRHKIVNICCVLWQPSLSCSMAISLTPDFELALSLSWIMAVMCCLFCFHHSYLTDSWICEFQFFLSLQAWMVDILDCKSWKREAHTIEVSSIMCTCTCMYMYMYMHMYSKHLSNIVYSEPHPG